MDKINQLLGLLGLSEEQQEQFTTMEGDSFDQATLDKLSITNRGKWEGILSQDGKFTEQFTSKGFKAGSTKAAAKTKKAVAEWLGLDITEEMADDTVFQDTVLNAVKAAKKSAKTDDAQVKAAIEQAVSDAKTAAAKEMEALQIRFQNERSNLVNGYGLDSFIRNAVGNKIPKGGLPVADVLNMAKMRLNGQYTVKHDDTGNVVNILDKEGHTSSGMDLPDLHLSIYCHGFQVPFRESLATCQTVQSRS